MPTLKTLALLCAALLHIVFGQIAPVSAQEKPPAAQPSTAPKPHPDVQVLLDKGYALIRENKWTDALNAYKLARGRAIVLQDKTGEAKALNNIGFVYYSTGQPQKALEQFQQTLPLFKAVGDRADEAVTLVGIGVVYKDTGQPQKALTYYQQALPLFKAVGNKAGEAVILVGIGTVYKDTGQSQKALEQFQQARTICEAVGDKEGEANSLNNIGSVCADTGQPQQALTYCQQALTICKAVGNKAEEARALNNIGSIYHSTGQVQKALEQYQQARTICKAAGDKEGEAKALFNIGNIYSSTGQIRQAQKYYQQALTIYKAVGDKAREARALVGIGSIYSAISQPQTALEQYQQALAIFKMVGDKAWEANALFNIGILYSSISQPQQALEQYQQARTICKAVGDKEGEAKALVGIGVVYYSTGKPHKALEQLQQALAIHKAVGDKTGEAATLVGIGTVYKDTGQPQKALTQYRQAMALVEKYRENIGSDTDSKQTYLQTTLTLYHCAIALLLQQQQPGETFALAQKVKARSLLDEMSNSKLDLDRDLTDEEHVQLITLRATLARLNKEQVGEALHSPDKQTPRFKELTLQLTKAQDQLASFRADLYRKRPQLALQQAAVTLDLPGAARLLTPDTALLEYVTQQADLGKGKKLDRTLLFVVTLQNGKPTLAVFPITLSRNTLAEKCDDLYAACSDKSLRAWEGKAAELYRLLIAPAQKQLVGKTRLLVCPDGPLWKTPFAVLRDPAGKCLWERYELSFAYSATGAWAAQEQGRNPARPHPTKTLLTVANPDFGDLARFGASDGRPIDIPSRDLFSGQRAGLSPLLGTKAEADALQQEFPDATVLMGKAAQEATVKQEAGAYRYLHFATHGLFNPNAPMLSFLALAEPDKDSPEDGFLTAREIYDLKLSADLAVLSACNTGRGEQKAGEGIVGLTWALQAAGCPSSVVSQWSVDDAATAALMGDLYRGLKAGKSTAAALRAAALKLHSDGAHAHPYYWAAFLLVGKGR